jgi:hypothetical protein
VRKRFEIDASSIDGRALPGRRISPTALICVVVCLLFMGCIGGASRVQPVKIDSSSASRGAIEMYDKDGDGAIAGSELDSVPGIKKHIRLYDQDGDGRVTRDEIAARLDDWSGQKLALMGATFIVMLDGQPLEGATVTFEPEPYLEPNVKPASGITASNGITRLSHAEEDLPKSANGRAIPGVKAGTYKLRITHPSRRIPAKYNTASELGDEVAFDTNPQGSPITLSLTSR